MVCKGQQVPWVQRDLQGRQVHKESKEQKVQMGYTGHKERKERKISCPIRLQAQRREQRRRRQLS